MSTFTNFFNKIIDLFVAIKHFFQDHARKGVPKARVAWMILIVLIISSLMAWASDHSSEQEDPAQAQVETLREVNAVLEALLVLQAVEINLQEERLALQRELVELQERHLEFQREVSGSKEEERLSR